MNYDSVYRVGKILTRKFSISSRNRFQVMDLGVLSRDLNCE